MAGTISADFYRSEADRLLMLAAMTVQVTERLRLMETALEFRRMAQRMERRRRMPANSNLDSGRKIERA